MDLLQPAVQVPLHVEVPVADVRRVVDRPAVEVQRVVLHVPEVEELAGEPRPVAGLLEVAGDRAVLVEPVKPGMCVVHHPMVVRVLPREETGAGRATQGSRVERLLERPSLSPEPMADEPQHLHRPSVGLVVRQEDQDVRAPIRAAGTRTSRVRDDEQTGHEHRDDRQKRVPPQRLPCRSKHGCHSLRSVWRHRRRGCSTSGSERVSRGSTAALGTISCAWPC